MKRVLMVAFHFPPISASSGWQRTLSFCRHLPEFGWQPSVLTVKPSAYESTIEAHSDDIPDGVEIHRTLALDTRRHLAVAGRHLKAMALPDRWISWWLSAVPAGVRAIRRAGCDVLWTTYPIATAHLIGRTLHRRTGIPWVADCRDWLYPEVITAANADPRWRVQRWIDGKMVRECARTVLTTPGAQGLYRRRYPEVESSRFVVIENGYNEESFQEAEGRRASRRQEADHPLLLVHSGLLDPDDRDPTAFFGALATLKRHHRLGSADLRIVLRATGFDDLHRAAIRGFGIEDLVHIEGAVPYAAALSEMLEADGLLIFQGSGCNAQIPAKLYEYLRARRPILALTDAAGDTAGCLRRAGVGSIVPYDDPAAIAAALPPWLDGVRSGKITLAEPGETQRFSRYRRAEELASLLDNVAP